ncbi:OmpP1/FadL family transporter [Chondromyces apiculatus]|uniref:FadL family outer membrane protein n=1 Tax=Chondromyces apiculatus DSM 436 TaxID=1192034 RepID=A0A017TCC5_9BACT|nr:outer membrane protein transport protein [Chondromyces apiculatus]EYF06276.1 FadL family outer membrane protein [Chondromyces apiculatus DSM 436]
MAAALLGGVTFAPAAARASGLDAPIVGPGDAGPTTADAASVQWNPAGLAFVKRPQLLLGAGLILGRVTYQRERIGRYQTPDTFQFKTPLDPANIDASKTGFTEEVGATPIAPTGDAFLAVPVHERLTVGLGVYVPHAAALSFPADGAQAWQLREAFIVASFITASAGVRLTDRLAAGLGISYVTGVAELSKLQDFASLDEFRGAFANDPINQPNDFGPDAPTEVRELDVLSRPISVKRALSHGATFNVGLTWQTTDALTLAAAYQHGSRMRYVGDFAIDMNDPLFTQDLVSQGLQYKPLLQGDAELTFRLPRRITLGAGFQASDAFRVDGFVQYVTYSDVDAFVVETRSPDLAQPKLGIGDRVKVRLPRDWSDTIWVEARAQYRATSWMKAWVTAGYQSPASPDSTIDVASPDGHRLIGGVGGELEVTDGFSLLGEARLQGILPRTVTESDHDLGNGTYGMFLAALGGHLRFKF